MDHLVSDSKVISAANASCPGRPGASRGGQVTPDRAPGMAWEAGYACSRRVLDLWPTLRAGTEAYR